jgi:hypothetical protein
MKCGRIKIGPIGPYEGVHFWIQSDLIENLLITERSIQRAGQNWLEIDLADKAVAKCHSQLIGTNKAKVCNAVKWVNHADTYGNGSIGSGSIPVCNRLQSAINSDRKPASFTHP